MISEATRRLVEHVAHQRGYEFAQRLDENTLLLSSSLAPGSVQVRGLADGRLELQFQMSGVAVEIRRERGIEPTGDLVAAGESDLYQTLGRAFSLSVALPDNPLQTFQRAISNLPRGTEAEQLVVQRVGQDIFRKSLDDYWQERCAVTGIGDRSLLRASHIRPWAESTDAERLDVFNGILLTAHLDAAFDKHLMTVTPTGELVFSPSRLSQPARDLLRSKCPAGPIRLSPQHQSYLSHHRARYQMLEAGRA